MTNADKIPCPGCGAAMEIVPRADYGQRPSHSARLCAGYSGAMQALHPLSQALPDLTVLYGFQYHCPRCGWDAPLKCTERDALEAARKRIKVEVVRCKDCLSGWPLPDGAKPFVLEDCLVCAMGRGNPICGYSIVCPDDYCSDGCKADGGGADHENT